MNSLSAQKPMTVTVGVSALNEGKNILSFLYSILSQKGENFILEKIIVISDGSTDDTVAQVSSVQDPRIIVHAHDQRAGQPTRLNELFQMQQSDILVKCDADTILGDNQAIARLVEVFVDPRVGMVCGSGRPLNPSTFTEKAVAITREAYQVLTRLNNGNNRHLINGRLMALRKEVAKNIHIPASIIGNDVYCYFACLTQGYEFRRVGEAVVYYRAPRTISEHIHQNTRFVAVSEKMSDYFPDDLVERECRLPRKLLVQSMIRQWFRHPILSTGIFFINLYCKIIARLGISHNLTSRWDISNTSKEVLVK